MCDNQINNLFLPFLKNRFWYEIEESLKSIAVNHLSSKETDPSSAEEIGTIF